MSLRTEEWCVCDQCDCEGPHVIAGFLTGAERAALAKGWRVAALNPYGCKAHFCRRCSAGKTDTELLAVLGLLPPDEDDPGAG